MVVSARLYGSRSNKSKKLLEDVQKAVENNVNLIRQAPVSIGGSTFTK